MSTISPQEIISITKSEIKNLDMHAGQGQETGPVIWVGDDMAIIYGTEHTMYGKIVMFENGAKGTVQDIYRGKIGCILFGKGAGVGQSTKVVRTRKRVDVPVGNGFLGRVVSTLGEPIDGLGSVKEEDYLPVEEEVPGIVDRKSVGIPMETGVLTINSTFPIDRGQRELIIGDRQTGKTSVAMGTILNQKGKGVACIYVAIGQRASIVAKLVSTLKENDAMDYTTVMSSTASETAPLQYITSYAGIAMAEYFMHQGKDVLIIYDDLSKHIAVYKALSLPLEHSLGREAYPGDVFYLHSRLLECSSRLYDEEGGGSIITLPIIETQVGDVSVYIPTSVVSITGGQIFPEGDLFFSGMRPTMSVELPVSRIDDATQTKVMKKVSGSVRIDLAQYREMEIFTRFSSDLDKATKKQPAYEERFMELLKQLLGRPLGLHEQVVIPCATTHKVILSVEVSDIRGFQMNMLAWFDEKHPEIGKEVGETKALGDDLINHTVDAANQYKTNQYKASAWSGERS